MVEVLHSDKTELIEETEENKQIQETESVISDSQQEEAALAQDITSSQTIEDWKIQQIEKIWKRKVKFPYESNEHKCDLILEKRWNNIFVKLEKIPTYMWNPMDNEFKKQEKKQWLTWKLIDASSSEIFLNGLWKALDDIIGKWRISAAQKAEEAYKLLWFTIN